MKRHATLVATAIAAALAMPASAGPLGAITGGGGALGAVTGGAASGVMGTLGGTLSAPVSTIGIGAGGVLGAGGQASGQIHRPDLTIQQAPLSRARQALDAAGDRAKSTAGEAVDRVNSAQLPSLPSSAVGNASAHGSASAGAASAGGEASGAARFQASY
jgi:hypothetical protein